MKGVPHYLPNGKLYTGKTHKMKDGTLHSGATHTKNSKKLTLIKLLSVNLSIND